MKSIKYLTLSLITLIASLFSISKVLADTNVYLDYQFIDDNIDISKLETIKENIESNFSNYDFDYMIIYTPNSDSAGGTNNVIILRKRDYYNDTQFYIKPNIYSNNSSSSKYRYDYVISAFNLTRYSENNNMFNNNYCAYNTILHFDSDGDILEDENYRNMRNSIQNSNPCYIGSNSNSIAHGSTYDIYKSSVNNNPFIVGLEEQQIIYYSSVDLHYINEKYNVAQLDRYSSITQYCQNPTLQSIGCTGNDTCYYSYDHLYYVGSYLSELECGNLFPTYYYYQNNMPSIRLGEQNYRYTEEDNNFIYKKRIIVNVIDRYLSDNYKITYKFVDELSNEVVGTINSSDNYLDIYLNGTLNVYIKDLNNNLIDSYSTTYSDMGLLSQRAAFDSNGNGNNMYSLNVHYSFGNMQRYGVMPFRIMFYSNDFSENNTPRMIGYKKYYIDSNNSKREVDSDFDLFKIDNLSCKKFGNQVICTGYIINKLIWNNFEIDFLFNHIENYSIHYFDQFTSNFSARDIDVLSNDLVGYTKYKFPSNSDRAYIYKKNSNQNVKTGSVVFPWYYTQNETINIRATYYKTNDFLSNIPFQNNDYYSKFDFDLTKNEVLTILLNRVNTCPFQLLNIEFDNIVCEYDSAYIFVPNDFIVNFNSYTLNEEENTYLILTDDDGNNIIIDKDYNHKNFYEDLSVSSFFTELTHYLDEIKNYTRVFTDLFEYFYNSQNSEIKRFLVVSFILILISSIIILARRH